ncbi:hypothetical protein [Staphylococcus phage vB_SauH_DELF3]|nr:hypothetical protein [Staphylococcus phage vB_SauH_DELF3]
MKSCEEVGTKKDEHRGKITISVSEVSADIKYPEGSRRKSQGKESDVSQSADVPDFPKSPHNPL